MKTTTADPLIGDIHLLLRGGAAGGLTDGELLGRFASSGDGAAFEVLVHRLGPMVLGVCRRLLRDRHDAEDAFQATFLVLARRATSVDPPERVGPWLHGVALRVAMRARVSRAKRRSREGLAPTPPEVAFEARSGRDERVDLLDAELVRLPEKYRAPIVLCHLEGKPYKEAARQLGLRMGTLSGRLTRGRALLASRLARRAAAFSAGPIAALLTSEASARVPASLAASTVGAALSALGPGSASAAVSAGVAALTRGTLRTMLMTKLRTASVALATVGLLGVGVAAGGRDDPPRPSTPAGAVDLPRSVERVEAYKIGDDLFLNVAEPGSGKIILEKVGTKGAASPGVAPTRLEGNRSADVKPAATPAEAFRILFDPVQDGRPDVVRTTAPAGPGNRSRDGEFLRRAYLDLLGRQPTPEEAAAYLASKDPEKAKKLVRKLADDPAALDALRRNLRERLDSLLAWASVGETKPARFELARAVLDRVDIGNGNLIDIRLDNGLDYPPTDRNMAHPMVDADGNMMVMPPATRIQAVPVAVDAVVTVEKGDGVIFTGQGTQALEALKPGMRLTLKLVAEGPGLAITEIKATPAVAKPASPEAGEKDLRSYYQSLYQAAPRRR